MISMTDAGKKTSGNRILYYDVLNVLSCIAVVALHHNGLVHSFTDTLAWRESLVVECALYWAVPVFLMISGANLLNYREKYSTAVYFKKRVLRTVIPWMIWSVFILVWKVLTGQMELESRSLRHIAGLILNFKVENVYWFFGALFACYLAIPVFAVVIKERKILWYIVLLNFCFLSVLKPLTVWLNFSWGLDIPVVGSLIIYVVLGYLLATESFDKKCRIVIYLLGMAGAVFRFIYTYILSIQNGKTDTSIKGYVIFHAVFLSVAVFEWGKNVCWERWIPDGVKQLLPGISSCSFGVYLIHRIVMYYEINITGLSKANFIWRICFVPVTYLISLGMVIVLKKLPKVGKVIC